MYDLKEDDVEKEHTLGDYDVCDDCGGTGVIEHPCMLGYYGDCYTCGAD